MFVYSVSYNPMRTVVGVRVFKDSDSQAMVSHLGDRKKDTSLPFLKQDNAQNGAI